MIAQDNALIERFSKEFYNALAIVDADGTVLGVYRKSHIPNSVGYQEKSGEGRPGCAAYPLATIGTLTAGCLATRCRNQGAYPLHR